MKIKNKYTNEVLVSDLYDEDFYIYTIDYWINEYKEIRLTNWSVEIVTLLRLVVATVCSMGGSPVWSIAPTSKI